MKSARRVQLEPAYLLHHRPYRDSSRIVEFYARDHGRVSLFAKGVRRAGSPFAAVLQPFTPLLVSWSGSGDGGVLTGAELVGQPETLPPPRLMSGFYLNELLLKLLPRQDAHPELYEAYALALDELRAPDMDEARPLRLFEKRLLEALGYGVDYTHVLEDGGSVEPGAYYHVRPERGVVGVAERPPGGTPRGNPAGTPTGAPTGSDPGLPANAYRGEDLLSLAAEELQDAASLAAARRLLRAQLDASLEGRELASRAVARAVRTKPVNGGESK